MLYVRTFPTITTSATPSPAQEVHLPDSFVGSYGLVRGFKARLTGTDTAVRVKLTDADGFVVYLDAADVDYKTADVTVQVVADPTVTGLGAVHLDATGAALADVVGPPANAPGFGGVLAKFPVIGQIVNGGTATDTVALSLYVEEISPIVIPTTTLASPTQALPTVYLPRQSNMGNMGAIIEGFTAKLTGADTAIRIKIVDNDSRVIYLDAADVDYKTAKKLVRVGADDTLTGLGFATKDATGAAMVANQGAGTGPFATFPVTVSVVNAGTATDTLDVTLLVR